MNALKLKETLSTNVPVDLILHRRGKEYPNKFHEGAMQYHYIFRDTSGKEYSHYANEREQETLMMFQPGEKLTVTRKEFVTKEGVRQYFVDWTTAGDISASAKPQLRTNTGEKTVEKNYEKEKLAYDLKLGIAGLLQAYIIRGADRDDARRLAIEDAQWVREQAKKLAEESL